MISKKGLLMIKKHLAVILYALLLIYQGASAKEPLVLNAAKKELNRSMTQLKTEKNPPYYISYSIGDIKSYRLNASFGKIVRENDDKQRILDIDMRIGDYQLDNTHIIRGAGFSFSSSKGAVDLPLEDDEEALRSSIWFATDASYKSAIERYEKVITNKAVKVKEEDSSADFSTEKPEKYSEEIPNITIDLNLWKERLRHLSSIFAKENWLLNGSVSFQAEFKTKYFISSEGSELQMYEPYIRIFVSAMTKADDGMTLPLYKSYFSYTPEGLPDDKTIEKDIYQLIATLSKLRTAELMKTYSGPAILSGEASGVFFHEIFGHRAEGHRQKDPSSSQTLKNFVDKSILPDFIDVYFDPTIKSLKGREISGHYVFDDEGVRAQKVMSVENGSFKNFLMSRSPIEHFSNSNGHGRKQSGYHAVSRQSNLVVDAHKTVTLEKLKEMLRDECKKQDKEWGLYFVQVQGGFTFTGTTIPNAFNVTPIIVYKIYADGRPDELVRGVDLIGTPLTTFSKVIAAADDLGIFNGICGAESGGVPVSASSPSLLVSQIEVQRKAKSQSKPPILPSPVTTESN
jgi:TldD protein